MLRISHHQIFHLRLDPSGLIDHSYIARPRLTTHLRRIVHTLIAIIVDLEDPTFSFSRTQDENDQTRSLLLDLEQDQDDQVILLGYSGSKPPPEQSIRDYRGNVIQSTARDQREAVDSS